MRKSQRTEGRVGQKFEQPIPPMVNNLFVCIYKYIIIQLQEQILLKSGSYRLNQEQEQKCAKNALLQVHTNEHTCNPLD